VRSATVVAAMPAPVVELRNEAPVGDTIAAALFADELVIYRISTLFSARGSLFVGGRLLPAQAARAMWNSSVRGGKIVAGLGLEVALWNGWSLSR
jgi:hypothetical protein